MVQLAEDYRQVSARCGPSPGLVDSSAPALEDRSGTEDFLDLFRGNVMPGNVIDTIKRPCQIIDSHTQPRAPIVHAIPAARKALVK